MLGSLERASSSAGTDEIALVLGRSCSRVLRGSDVTRGRVVERRSRGSSMMLVLSVNHGDSDTQRRGI
jgi:hypothetical protein